MAGIVTTIPKDAKEKIDKKKGGKSYGEVIRSVLEDIEKGKISKREWDSAFSFLTNSYRKGEEKVALSISLPEEEKERLKEIARELETTPSNLCRTLLSLFLYHREEEKVAIQEEERRKIVKIFEEARKEEAPLFITVVVYYLSTMGVLKGYSTPHKIYEAFSEVAKEPLEENPLRYPRELFLRALRNALRKGYLAYDENSGELKVTEKGYKMLEFFLREIGYFEEMQ